MAWENIHVDDFGWVGNLTIKQDGVAVDVSSYTTLQFVFESPSGVDSTETAAFDSDGTDGVITYTVQDGDIDEVGIWKVSARVAKTGAELTSDPLLFEVLPRTD